MRYNGGKSACAKDIASLINKFNPVVYWEPFVGAANVIQYVNAGKRKGTDKCPYIICLLQAIQAGWVPPQYITEDKYKYFKEHKPLDPMTAFIGYGCSFGGKWFGGYARSNNRNYALNAHNSLLKQASLLTGIEFKCDDYNSNTIVAIADLIYCDPPYANTTKAGSSNSFDTATFWQWAATLSTTKTVLVSEFVAPDDWVCVYEKTISDGLRRKDNSKMVEKLFIHKSRSHTC